MHRVHVRLSMLVIMLLGGVCLDIPQLAVAQEATPGCCDTAPEGVTFEPLTLTPTVAVGSPFELYVVRMRFEPGSVVPADESDPSVGIIIVESGTLTVQVEGRVQVTRGATFAEALATADETGDVSGLIEVMAAGELITLEAGDAAYIPANVSGEIRNVGQELAVGLGLLVIPAEGRA
jgi:quercetin dioxygenase-like cupin family protein